MIMRWPGAPTRRTRSTHHTSPSFEVPLSIFSIWVRPRPARKFVLTGEPHYHDPSRSAGALRFWKRVAMLRERAAGGARPPSSAKSSPPSGPKIEGGVRAATDPICGANQDAAAAAGARRGGARPADLGEYDGDIVAERKSVVPFSDRFPAGHRGRGVAELRGRRGRPRRSL